MSLILYRLLLLPTEHTLNLSKIFWQSNVLLISLIRILYPSYPK